MSYKESKNTLNIGDPNFVLKPEDIVRGPTADEWLIKLQAENKNLRKIITKELSENDEFGSEFVMVSLLKDDNRQLIEKLNIARKFIRRFVERVDYDWTSQAVKTLEESEFVES